MLATTLFDSNVSGVATSADAMRLGGLDWKAELRPMYYQKPDGDIAVVPDRVANVRGDNGAVLGVVSPRYQNVQNEQAFALLDAMAGQGMSMKYETAGTLFDGRRVFMTAQLPESVVLGDRIRNLLFIGNSFDTSMQLTVGLTNVRVVCSNTLQLAINDAPRIWRVRHNVADIEERWQEAALALNLCAGYMRGLEVKAEELALKRIDVEKAVKALFPCDDGETPSKLTQDRRDKVLDIVRDKDDLANFRNTAYGFYQAVADWFSNNAPERQTDGWEDRRRNDLLFGSDVLARAQEIAEAA